MDTNHAARSLPTEAPHALEGVWAKLRRAQEHILALREATAAYLGIPPYQKVRTEEEDGWERVTARVTTPTPLRLATIFGDVLHCCDCALDQTAWAFARTRNDPPHKRTEWPVYVKPEWFERRRKDAFRDIPAEVLAVMEDLQPYSTHPVGSDIGQQLAVMRGLSNEDKHRLVPVVTLFVAPQAIAFHDSAAPVEWLEEDRRLVGYRLRRGDSLAVRVQELWEAVVSIERDDLPWRSGLEGIATHLYDETTFAIAALRPHWRLLRELHVTDSAWWRGG